MLGNKLLRMAGEGLAWSRTTFILLALALLPTLSFAAGGEDVALEFNQTNMIFLWISLAFGIIAVIYGAILFKQVKSASPGDEKMQEVGLAIREGAMAYLRQQGRMISFFVAILSICLGGLYFSKYGVGVAVGIAVCFILGVAASYLAGYIGMVMAVNANMRTAAAALTSYKKSLEVSFRAGGVAGMMTVGLGLIGATIIFALGGKDSMRYLVGFGFGGSLAALFMRVGGGIYTKAADVGADLVGKVEAGIPEDDPRNPAVIADNVGDNVGDCAGMAADVFESYEVTLVAAIVLGAATATLFPTEIWMKLVLFALMARGVGVIASIIGIQSVKGSDDLNSNPLKAISGGFSLSAIIGGVLTVALAYGMMGGYSGLGGTITTLNPKDREEFVRAEQQQIRKIAESVIPFKQKQIAEIRQMAEASLSAEQKAEIKDGTPAFSLADADALSKDEKVVAMLEKQGYKKEQALAVVRHALSKFRDPKTMKVSDLLPEDVLRDKRINDLVKRTGRQEQMFGTGTLSQVLNADPKAAQFPLPNVSGFTPLKWDDARLKNYSAIREQEGNTPPDPNEVVPFVERFRKNDVKEQMKIMRIKIVQKPPTEGPQASEPPQEFTVYYGPVTTAKMDELITQAKQQGPNNEFTVEDEFPTQFLINRDGEIALGVSMVGLKGMKLENPAEMNLAGGVSYFREPADRVKEINTARTQDPTGTPLAKQEQGKVVFVSETPVEWWRFALCILVGILMAFVFERLTDYYVSTDRRPTREVAGVASAGPAPMIIQGFALGKESSVMSVLAICIALLIPLFIFPPAAFGGPLLSFYGVALVGLGLLSTTGYILAMDTFGPISDNAQGVFEMSGAGHSNPEASAAVQRLDAAGNTTKALTKGFAIATAVVAAVALFHSFVEAAKLTTIGMSVDVPQVFIGMLIGGAAPFLFSAFLINAVGRASFQLIGEVRTQFKNDPGIMAGTSKPNYGNCVAIVTQAAQKELLGPGILAIALPLFVVSALGLGANLTTINGVQYNLAGVQALGGFLAGTILSGQLLAVMLANSGGIWDNAKKLIEDGMHGGKGTEAHKAGVVCDTVGDPFKDTAGPALNPLIKVMNLVALLLAPSVIFPGNDEIRYVIVAVSLIMLIAAFVVSKKGSIATEMEAMTSEEKA